MRRVAGIAGGALFGAIAFVLAPALLDGQAASGKTPEEPEVVTMEDYRVSAPPGKGWQIERLDGDIVSFIRSREGLFPGQERRDDIVVMPQIVNIYGWQTTEEEVAEQIFQLFTSLPSPPGTAHKLEDVEWDGKKLHSLRSEADHDGAKMVSISLLYFPDDFAKSHRYFKFGFGFERGAMRMTNDPSLEPLRAVIRSFEILDPLRALTGPHGDLVRAAAAGDAAGVIGALDRGADINAGGPGRGALTAAASCGRREIVDLLLERGAAIDTPDAVGGATPLLAAIIGREPEIARLLVAKGADVRRKISAGGGSGVTALMFAAAIGDLDLARAIIDAGANLEARTALGETALVLSADNGWTDGAALMLERGADANARMSNGWTAVMRAADKGHSEIVSLLLKNRADPNFAATDDGRTALMMAVGRADIGMVKALIESGADVNARTPDSGYCALHAAVLLDSPEIAAALLEAGAAVDQRLQGGATPLMIVAESGTPGMLELLLAKGADIQARTDAGQTAMKFAQKKKRADIVKLLKTAGAKGPSLQDHP